MNLPAAGGKRVAFFGGSFDPPHLGHLAVARAARLALGLDTVLFAPVGAQPLKPGGAMASFRDRAEMTRLAIAGEAGFDLSLADAPKPSGAPNYTWETLMALRARLPADGRLYCLMGADAFMGLKGWRRAAEIPFVAPLVVASRPGQRLAGLETSLPEGLAVESDPDVRGGGSHVEMRRLLIRNSAGDKADFYLLPGLHVDVSASQIREQARELARKTSESPGVGLALLQEMVAAYIRAHQLYR